MIDCEYSMDIFKTKKVCKHAVKKLPFQIRYVPDQYNV